MAPEIAQDALQQHALDLDTTIKIAMGLIQTIKRRKKETREYDCANEREIQRLHKQIESMEPTDMQPEGYERNNENRAPNFTIPIQDGYYQPAW